MKENCAFTCKVCKAVNQSTASIPDHNTTNANGNHSPMSNKSGLTNTTANFKANSGNATQCKDKSVVCTRYAVSQRRERVDVVVVVVGVDAINYVLEVSTSYPGLQISFFDQLQKQNRCDRKDGWGSWMRRSCRVACGLCSAEDEVCPFAVHVNFRKGSL